jgi:hypothetical protein
MPLILDGNALIQEPSQIKSSEIREIHQFLFEQQLEQTDDGWVDEESLTPSSIITKLVIKQCRISLQNIRQLFRFPKPLPHHLLAIDFDRTPILDAGLQVLSRSLEFLPCLTAFSARGCGITSAGLQVFLQQIQDLDIPLEELYLSQNNVRDNGAAIISRFMVHENSLRTLHISYNNIGLLGATLLSDMLQMPSCKLDSFSIMCNPFGIEGFSRLLRNITEMKTLKNLIIGNTPPFNTYYIDYPRTFDLADLQPMLTSESDSTLDILSNFLNLNPYLSSLVIFGLEGDCINGITNAMQRNTLLESITIPGSLDQFDRDPVCFKQLFRKDKSLNYAKIEDGFNYRFELDCNTAEDYRIHVQKRDSRLVEALHLRRILWLIEWLPADLYDHVLNGHLLDYFQSPDRLVLVSFLTDKGFLGCLPDVKFSVTNFVRHCYIHKPNYPRI